MSRKIIHLITPNNIVVEATSDGQVRKVNKLLTGINFKLEGYKWKVIEK